MQTPADPNGSPRDAPAFPVEAIEWLVDGPRRKVSSLAPAYLTEALSEAGHHVMALPGNGTTVLDAVIASNQLPQDLEGIAGLLRSGGRLSLVCSQRDQRVPWARKLDLLLGITAPEAPADALANCPRFAGVEEETFRYWQVVNQESLERILRAELHAVDAPDVEAKVAAALELYADYGRGNDGMQMPWVSTCYRATVIDGLWATPEGQSGEQTQERTRSSAAIGDDDALFESSADATLLIDFR